MLERFNVVQDNVWAFGLFALASLIAVSAGVLEVVIIYRFHGSDYSPAKDLLQFAGTVAMTGAALFHGKNNASEK